jgi:hypothetical protein
MPSPLRALISPSSGAEAFAIVVALIAAGMFIGNWVIGPAISTDIFEHSALPSATRGRATIDAMSARPDPLPYRTPTPAFDTPDAPRYGALAKERAQAEIGGRSAARSVQSELPEQARDAFDDGNASPSPPRSRAIDRHSGIHY